MPTGTERVHHFRIGAKSIMSMIEAKKLRKVFGPIEAVKGVSFSVERGEALGFLGPNGAGKSTVMRMLTCFITPTSGSATIGGHDILSDSMEARRLVGYVPENSPTYGDMTVNGFLKFIGQMRGYEGKELQQHLDRVIEMCWLESVTGQSTETLSKGFQRRVGLAQALIHDPPILILDEPTDGLDPNQKHEVRELIQKMTAEKAIIISTHILEEVESVCTRAVIIAKGQLVADATPGELRRQSSHYNAVHLTVAVNGSAISEKDFSSLEQIERVETLERTDDQARFVLFPRKGANLANPVLELARERKWNVQDIKIDSGDLNEVFRDITLKEGEHS